MKQNRIVKKDSAMQAVLKSNGISKQGENLESQSYIIIQKPFDAKV